MLTLKQKRKEKLGTGHKKKQFPQNENSSFIWLCYNPIEMQPMREYKIYFAEQLKI